MNEELKLITDDKLFDSTARWTNLALSAINDCPKIKKEREVAILRDRFGIGKKPKTLHAIGTTYGVTRERIRQIVNNSIKKIQKNCISDELKKNIKNIESQVDKNGGIISKEKLAKVFNIESSNEENALNFCANLSNNLDLIKESKDLRQSWAKKYVKTKTIKKVARDAIDFLKGSKKVISTTKLATEIGQAKNITAAILDSTKAVMTTDSGEWGLAEWPQVNPKSIRDKSKYIMIRHGKPMHYSELTNMIVRMGTKQVTKQSVHNELIKNQEFVLVGRGIYALSEWGYEPGVVEEVIVEVLEEEGGPLHKKEIVSRVLEKRIVKESTIVLNLQKDRFKRIDKAVYTLN